MTHHPRGGACECCAYLAELINDNALALTELIGGLNLGNVGAMLTGLHVQLSRIEESQVKIMTAQDDIAAAVAAQTAAISEQTAAIAALGAAGTPADTSALVASTASLTASTAALAAAVAPPAPGPVAAEAPAGEAEPVRPASPF